MPRRPTRDHDFANHVLDYRFPTERRYLQRFAASPADTKLELDKPYFRSWNTGVRYDQGIEGACVGFSIAGWSSAFDLQDDQKTHRFDARWIYQEAKRIDEWPGEDYEGTSLNAGLDVGRTQGYSPIKDQSRRLYVDEYKWAGSSADVMSFVANVGPAIFGMYWYQNFDNPVQHPFNEGKSRKNFFIGEGDLGPIRGGHAIVCTGYYRNRSGNEWVRFQNSWGFNYPLVWMPRQTLDYLFNAGEVEVAFITQASWR